MGFNGGGYNSLDINTLSTSTTSYQIKVPEGQVSSVLYSTSSQSNIVAPYETVDGYRIYSVEADESPTSFYITPASTYGIRSVTDEKGKTYTSAPRKTRLYASQMTTGVPVTVNIDQLSNILTGTLVVKILDEDTSPFHITVSTGSYSLDVHSGNQSGNTWTVQYDPLTEGDWSAYRSDSKIINFARIDGERCKSSNIAVPTETGSYVFRSHRGADLTGKSGEHILKLSTDYPELDVPLTFEYEQEGGNETNPEYLTKMIRSVTINGTQLTDKSWQAPGFTVKNGSTVIVEISPQVQGTWEWKGSWFNGTQLASSRTTCYVETDEPNDVQTYKIKGLLNSPWRFKIITEGDYSKYRYTLDGNSQVYSLESNAHIGQGEDYTAPVIKPYYDNTGATTKLYRIDAVTVNGKKVALDANRGYTPTVMDEEITIIPVEYLRNTPIAIECEPAEGKSSYDIVLDPYGLMCTTVTLQKGANTVYVNLEEDGGLDLGDYNGAMFINKSKAYAWDVVATEGYHTYSAFGLERLKNAKSVKVYGYYVPTNVIQYQTDNGIKYTAYHDGEEVSTDKMENGPYHTLGDATYEVLETTKVKIVPEIKSGLVIDNTEFDPTLFFEQEANGEFNFDMSRPRLVNLHYDTKITINCAKNYELVTYALSTDYYPYPGSYYKSNAITDAATLASVEEHPRLIYKSDSDQYSMLIKLSDENYTLSYTTSRNPYYEIEAVKDPISQSYTIEDIYPGDVITLKVEEKKTQTWTVRVFPPKSLNLKEKTIGDANYVNAAGETVASPFKLAYKDPDKSNVEFITLNYGLNSIELAENMERVSVGSLKAPTYSGGWEDYTEPPYSATIYTYSADNYGYYKDWRTLSDSYNYYTWQSYYSSEIPPITIKPSDEYYYNGYNFTEGYTYGYTIYSPGMEPYKCTEMMGDSFGIFKGQSIKIIPSDDRCIGSFVIRKYSNWGSDYEDLYTFYPDADGIFRMSIPDFEDTTDLSEYIQFEPVEGEMNVTFNFDDSKSSIAVKDQNNTSYTPSSGTPQTMALSKKLTITCSDPNSIISKVVDKVSGMTLAVGTGGVVTGIQPDMELEVTFETRERNKKVKFVTNGSFTTNNQVTLAKGTKFEKIVKLASNSSTDVSFSDEDLPLETNIRGYKTTSRTYYNAYIFHNDQLLSTTRQQINILNNVMDGDVIRYSDASTTRNVKYDIEEGLHVNITHDGRKISDTFTEGTVPNGTMIKIEENTELNKDGYEVLRNGTALSATLLANGFAASLPDEEVVVRRTYNTLTVNAKEGTDLTKVLVYDDHGNQYTLTAGSNTLTLPSRVETLTLLTADELSYVSEAVSEPAMSFDPKRGQLTGLTTGTVTLAVKNVVRDNEAVVYIHEAELNGSSVVLADNSVIQSGATFDAGRHTVKYGDEDLPVVFRLPEGFAETAVNPENPAAVYVNGNKIDYSAEANGYVLPEEAFTDENHQAVVKAFESEPVRPNVIFLVEDGITFSAVGDDNDEDVIDNDTAEGNFLPGTELHITAKSDKEGEIIQIVVANEVVEEGTEIDYELFISNYDQMVKLQHKKYPTKVTYSAGEGVTFTATAADYTPATASGVKEYLSGTVVTLKASTSLADRFVEVTIGDEVVAFDKNVEYMFTVRDDDFTVAINAVTFDRDKFMQVYVDEENGVEAGLILSQGKATEKEITLKNGYQELYYHVDDLPLAFRNILDVTTPLTVYVNGTEINYTEGVGYEFPTELEEKSVVKIYAETQPEININYTIVVEGFDIAVKHDRVTDVDLTQKNHVVLPGTEIALTVSVPEAQTMNARKREKADDKLPVITINSKKLQPEEDGTYLYKVTSDDVDRGVNVEVTPGDVTTSVDAIFADGKDVDVFDIKGVLIIRKATREDLKHLEPGVYVIDGKKYLLK